MRRHTITLGASTTTGGKVISASSNGGINGIKIAVEGDTVSCPACKTEGKIVCVGPRIPETWNCKQVALESDLCLCRCFPSPKLVANQSLRYQVIEQTAKAPFGESATQVVKPPPLEPVPENAVYDLDFLVVDHQAGLPLSDWPYAIELASGHHIQGRTDQAGKTTKISAADAEHAVLHLYEPEVSPITPFWDR